MNRVYLTGEVAQTYGRLTPLTHVDCDTPHGMTTVRCLGLSHVAPGEYIQLIGALVPHPYDAHIQVIAVHQYILTTGAPHVADPAVLSDHAY